MDFVDTSGTRYQLTETAESVAPAKKPVVWPWVIGGLALAGGLVWMASASARSPNPIEPEQEALITEARDPNTSRDRLWALFKHPEVEVRRALLDNPNVCPTDEDGKLNTNLLRTLAQEFPEEVAESPLFVLHALLEPVPEMEGVVSQVVQGIKDDGMIERLLGLWGPSSWVVRKAAAMNPRTPGDLLRTLGNEQTEIYGDVREAVAENRNTPVDLLHTLNNEKTESYRWVREAAKKALARRRLA